MEAKNEYSGVWYLPENPELEVHGELTFSPERGAHLKLIGAFGDATDFRRRLNPTTIPLILGKATDGTLLTLHNCYEKSVTDGSTGVSESHYLIRYVFVGGHFGTVDDLRFDGLSVRFSNLDVWVGVSGFDQQQFVPPDEIVVKYKRPGRIPIGNVSKFDLSVDVRFGFTPHSFLSQKATLSETTYLCFEYQNQSQFDQCMNDLRGLQHFLSLATARPTFPLSVRASIATLDHEVGVLYQYLDTGLNLSLALPNEMLFRFSEVRGNIQHYLQEWFGSADHLKPVYDLYFAVIFSPRMYLEHQFLSIAQAVEAYHRLTSPETDLPEDQHQARLKAILDSAPDEYKDWLGGRLQYSNELSLRKRLKGLLQSLSGTSVAMFPEKKLINQAVNTRNYFTHYDTTLIDQAAKGADLYRLTNELRRLLEACLLLKMEFPKEQIAEFVTRDRQRSDDAILG